MTGSANGFAQPQGARPQVTVVLAMSADGKLAAGQTAARFGSAADQAHLEAQVALADGVLFGAGTLRAYGTTMTVRSHALQAERRQRHQPPQPVQVVCSASGALEPTARFFQQPTPRWLLTTPAGAEHWRQVNLPDAFERVIEAPKFDWATILQDWGQTQGWQRLAILGGGRLVTGLLAAGVVDDLWLTVCPLLLGGEASPTLVQGVGWASDQLAPRLKLLSAQPQGDEVFLHYQVAALPHPTDPAPGDPALGKSPLP
jgi:5-amino-6-(5-phosphoribosylamino)uracil reductase